MPAAEIDTVALRALLALLKDQVTLSSVHSLASVPPAEGEDANSAARKLLIGFAREALMLDPRNSCGWSGALRS